MATQPQTFVCPHCGQHVTYAPEHAGVSGACPRCDRPITMPRAAPRQFTPAREPSGSGSGFTDLIMAGLLGLVGYWMDGLIGAIGGVGIALVVRFLFMKRG